MNTVWVDSDNAHQLNDYKRKKKERKKENDQKLAIIQN